VTNAGVFAYILYVGSFSSGCISTSLGHPGAADKSWKLQGKTQPRAAAIQKQIFRLAQIPLGGKDTGKSAFGRLRAGSVPEIPSKADPSTRFARSGFRLGEDTGKSACATQSNGSI
jgi:hypothetical protein